MLLSSYYQNAKAQIGTSPCGPVIFFGPNITITSPLSFPTGTYIVDDNFIININNGGIVTFTNSTIIMDPGSGFRLDGTGQLIFQNCTVRECTDTWESIRLLSTSCSLSVSNSTIRGADEAIVDVGGGTILLDQVNMEDNYMHVRLLGSSNTATSFATFGSKFLCNNATIPISNNPNYIGMPRTVHAIEVNDVNYRILGDGTSLANRNEIRNADVGIWIFRTGCEIYNFFIWQTDDRTGFNECGILARCPITQGVTADLTVGGYNNPYDGVFIWDAENGIRVSNWYNVTVVKSGVSEISRFGIFVENCPQRDITISDNEIYLDYNSNTSGQGMIGICNRQNDLANVTISRNTIELFGLPTGSLPWDNTGISIEDDILNAIYSNSHVIGNIVNDFEFGIYAVNSITLEIHGNKIHIPQATLNNRRWGIRTDNCNGINIEENEVESTWTFCSHRGIQTTDCINTTIKCNRIDNGGTQIFLNGGFDNNLLPDGIMGNGMHQGTVGLKVSDPTAILGINGSLIMPADNHWEKNYTTGCTGGSGCVVLPTNPGAIGQCFVRDNPTTGKSVFDPNSLSCITNPTAGILFNLTGIQPNNTTSQVDWYCSNILKRQGNREAGDSSSTSAYVGYFNLVSKLKSMESYSIFSLNSLAEYIVTNGIESTDSLYIQYLDLQFAQDAILMCSIQNEIKSGNVSNGLDLLSQSTFEGEAFQLLAYVLEYQLMKKLNPETNFGESTLDSLRMIAHLCPYTYGQAVYLARVSMQINAKDTDEDCGKEENQSLIRVSGKPGKNTTQVLEMYPNPVEKGKDLTISNANYLIGGIDVTNVLGQQVFQYSVSKEQSEITFPVNLIPGIYYLRVRFTNNTIAVQKLVVK